MVYIALSPRGLRPRASVQYTPYNPSCPCYNYYISFFSGVGKITFLTAFFQYASFIAGGRQPLGSMGILDTQALLSFLRLVGCAYFKKHTSAFEHPTPIALYQSIDIVDPLKHHEEWLQVIRQSG